MEPIKSQGLSCVHLFRPQCIVRNVIEACDILERERERVVNTKNVRGNEDVYHNCFGFLVNDREGLRLQEME